jgi:hypothetical protein
MRLPFAVKDRVPNGALRGSNDLYNMLYVGFPLGEAVFLVLGGPQRWQGEQFTYARMIPGSPYSWAVAIALFAVVLALGVLMPSDEDPERRGSARGWLIVLGATGCAVWCSYYAYCSFMSGQVYPTQVSFNGSYVWACFSIWYMIKVGQHLEFRHSREKI